MKTPDEIEQLILDMGYDVSKNTKSVIAFIFNGREITYFHKSQWSSGKGIEDGRGWDHLYNQIKPKDYRLCCPNCGHKF